MTWQDLQSESTFDLIDFIKYKGEAEYSELAESAFLAFTFRFRKEVIDKCRKIGRNWGYDNEVADGIAEAAFERFWQYPYGFNAARCKNPEPDNCVRFYLFRIANHCFFDYVKHLTLEETSPYDGSEDVVVEFPAIDNLDISDSKKEDLKKMRDLIDAALKTLTPKHKVIYLTYKAYEKEGYKLPRPLLEKLREDLNLSQNSIRVYKKQAFQAIEKHLKNHGID